MNFKFHCWKCLIFNITKFIAFSRQWPLNSPSYLSFLLLLLSRYSRYSGPLFSSHYPGIPRTNNNTHCGNPCLSKFPLSFPFRLSLFAGVAKMGKKPWGGGFWAGVDVGECLRHRLKVKAWKRRKKRAGGGEKRTYWGKLSTTPLLVIL